jgi:hypothetical protein
MNEPADDEAEILDKIRRFSDERRNTPESERKYVTRPEKYNYPIGIDPEGNPYPVHRRQTGPSSSEDDG